MRGLQITFNVLLTVAVLMIIWYFIPARMMFNPTSVTIEGSQVTVYRTFPMRDVFGPPLICYTEILRPLDGSTPCVDSQEFRYTNPSGRPYGTWNIRHFAARCLDNPSGYIYWVGWSPRMFDLIPMRPVELSITVRPPGQ